MSCWRLRLSVIFFPPGNRYEYRYLCTVMHAVVKLTIINDGGGKLAYYNIEGRKALVVGS